MGMTRTLNGREADRLFRAWGFVPLKSKGKHAGGHAFYGYLSEDGPRASITAPGRKHGTPEVSYRKAAQIVGVTFQEFLLGPDEYVKTHGEAALEALKDPANCRRRGTFDPTTLQPEIDTTTLPVIEETPMSRHSPGAVQTPLAEFSDRVLNVLQIAEAPMAFSTVADAAGLQGYRGESVQRAVEFLNQCGVEVVEDYRSSKGRRPFKVLFLKGGKADPATQVEQPKPDPLLSLTLGDGIDLGPFPPEPKPKKEEPVDKRVANLAAARERIRQEMEDRVLKVAEFIATQGYPQTRQEIQDGLGLTVSQARDTITQGIAEGILFRRLAQSDEMAEDAGSGRLPHVYFTETRIPRRKKKAQKIGRTHVAPPTTGTLADEDTTFTDDQIEEITMEQVTEKVQPQPTPTPVLDPDIPSIQILRTRPDGSLLLVDAAGDLYVAKKVEV